MTSPVMGQRQISPCGIDCRSCSLLNVRCRGCVEEEGRIFWTPGYMEGIDVCPIFECCVSRNEMTHCGECDELPCGIYMGLIDPDDPEAMEAKNRCIERLRSFR